MDMNELTAEQKVILAVVELNKAMKKTRHEWTRKIGRLEISYCRRSKNELWGRFGGGWNWELGFVAGGRTTIFNLLVATLRISMENPDPPKIKREDG